MERISKSKIKMLYYEDFKKWLNNYDRKISTSQKFIKHKLRNASKKEVVNGLRKTHDKIENKFTSNLIIHMSMHRSGCHAISNYIYNLYDLPKIYLEDRSLHGNVLGFNKPSTCSKNYLLSDKNTNLVYLHPIERAINEDWNSNNISNMFINWESYIGKFCNVIYIISIRDFFNNFASRIQRENMSGCLKNKKLVNEIIKDSSKHNYYLSPMIDTWKNYAREFLGITNYLSGHKKILVNYNNWIDENGKIQLSNDIGLKSNNFGFDKIPIDEIPRAGGGSSFTGTDMELKKEDLLTRWKMCLPENNKVLFELCRHIFKDRELVELNERIFGHIEGTEIFYE